MSGDESSFDVAGLMRFAESAGLIETVADLELVERVAAEVVARRQAYLAGYDHGLWASKPAIDVKHWRDVVTGLGLMQRARVHRDKLYDTASRPGDFTGRQPRKATA